MKKILFFASVLVLFVGTQCFTPMPVSQEGRYNNRVTPGNKITSQGSNFLVEETPQNRFVLKRFYFETSVQTTEFTFVDRTLKTLDGPATQWLDNGKIWTRGNYKNGGKTGAWTEYAFGFNDVKLRTGEYLNNEKNGIWLDIDTLGKKRIETLFDKGQVVNQTYFNPDGSLDSITLERCESHFNIQVEPAYPCDQKFASLGEDCNLKSMYNYLTTTMNYPGFAKDVGISGTAYLSFVVDKEGDLRDIIVLQGVCNSIKAECVRVVSGMPRWSPGMANGHPVKVRYTLPMRFKLE